MIRVMKEVERVSIARVRAARENGERIAIGGREGRVVEIEPAHGNSYRVVLRDADGLSNHYIERFDLARAIN